jgi:hypothetical protein
LPEALHQLTESRHLEILVASYHWGAAPGE